ncbi:hypothetical protein HHK36_026482 [Tetracentron sinense]|uniref:Uncharacterized protein n=1 Tax=Tetracentron sinense TaxID=13715 RepID=A0A834YIT9_TETSI|nr:hypothetical protein HHK36_026482 [Tetracentron sinense]
MLSCTWLVKGDKREKEQGKAKNNKKQKDPKSNADNQKKAPDNIEVKPTGAPAFKNSSGGQGKKPENTPASFQNQAIDKKGGKIDGPTHPPGPATGLFNLIPPHQQVYSYPPAYRVPVYVLDRVLQSFRAAQEHGEFIRHFRTSEPAIS